MTILAWVGKSGAREPARRSAVAIAGPAASCNEDIKISLCPQTAQTCPRAELSRRPGVDPARPAVIRQERPMREKTQLNLELFAAGSRQGGERMHALFAL